MIPASYADPLAMCDGFVMSSMFRMSHGRLLMSYAAPLPDGKFAPVFMFVSVN